MVGFLGVTCFVLVCTAATADFCSWDNFWTTFHISFIFGRIDNPDLLIFWLDLGWFCQDLDLEFSWWNIWCAVSRKNTFLIATQQKTNISVECWASNVAIKVDIGHDLDLEFSRSDIWFPIQCNPDISRSRISRNWIYRGRMLDPIFWRPRARCFSRNRGNSLDPIRGRQFFAKSAHRDSLCSRFAGDNFSRNQLKPTCQCGLEHMLCDGQPR